MAVTNLCIYQLPGTSLVDSLTHGSLFFPRMNGDRPAWMRGVWSTQWKPRQASLPHYSRCINHVMSNRYTVCYSFMHMFNDDNLMIMIDGDRWWWLMVMKMMMMMMMMMMSWVESYSNWPIYIQIPQSMINSCSRALKKCLYKLYTPEN